MKRFVSVFILAICIFTSQLKGSVRVVPADSLSKYAGLAKPGDTLVIAPGVYKDLVIDIRALGEESRPVVIKADPGSVTITGRSCLRLSGEWAVLNGVLFRGCTPPAGNSVLEYRIGDKASNNCRITNCVFDSCNPDSREKGYSYVLIYGRNNRFDHNSLLNKLNIGVTLIVMLDRESDRQNYHRIDNNYFGPKPVFGSNGAETIRVGTSVQALKSSNTIIENNLFDRCNGEVEVVSIKSCDNIIRNNIFYECQGVLALRHGDRNVAEGNLFDGDGVRNSGGIRVINAGHKVLNNTFVNLKGERFFSALAVMNAVPNSLPNRYCQVKDVDIKNNTFVNCDHITFGVGNDAERTLAPEDVRFTGNIIINVKAAVPFEEKSTVQGFSFRDNRVMISKGAGLPSGFTADTSLSHLRYPLFEGTERVKFGAQWYSALKADVNKTVKTIEVSAGQDNLLRALARASAGDTILLTSEGEYPASSDIFIDFPITIKAQKGLKHRPVLRYNGSIRGNIVTIRNGGELRIYGVAFNGAGEPGKVTPSAGISTLEGMIMPYTLEIDNCEFCDFPEGTTIPVRGAKNTFSELITIKNSLFRAISADAIFYAAERDDAGVYNVERLIIQNCSFNRILGVAINVYRGGSDESTAGPEVTVSNCTFEDVCNKERGSVLRLIGAQILSVSNCNFSNSGRAGVSVRLDETTFEKVKITNCNLWNSGRILSMTGKAVQGTMSNVKPQYLDPEKFDYRVRKESLLYNKNIGVR